MEVSRKDLELTESDIQELVDMYKSGNYYLKEMMEWFGISRKKLLKYLDEAKQKGMY